MVSSVCAVVVTYNRKILLLDCLKALQEQTVPLDKVLIIDNASSDGTIDYLNQSGILQDKRFILHCLKENLGGAGGFHEGIKIAFQEGYDYFFLMDDDGYPAKDCLEKLLPYARPDLCLGSLVIDRKDGETLAFPIRLPQTKRLIKNKSDALKTACEGIIENVIIPFNGVLLANQSVKKYGLPRSEYFIWGDDMEYVWRLQREGVQIKTVLGAIFYHPREDRLGTPMFFKQLHFNDSPSFLKLYCMSRNNTANLLKYKGKIAFIAFVLKWLWFYSFTHPDISKLLLGLKGMKAALQGDFTRHHAFINKENSR